MRVPLKDLPHRLLISMLVAGLLVAPYLALTPPPEVSAQTGLPTSMVGEGIYYVYATREGLVGYTTSNGHRIVENDFFVSLPACLSTNCPGGPYWGQMTNCADKCYVKVVNPVTNQCRVEPIKDVGPWFTVDDWWNPTHVRYLNRLSTIPQQLPQGYTGSDAARDGLNVGYGRSSSGIGHDNTHEMVNRGPRAVGNRAAIDLADGTWRNLRLTSPDTIGSRVYVYLLWQTGGSPAAEAAVCGHPLNQQGGTGFELPVPSTTPLPYPPVTSTVAVTPVIESFAHVTGTGGVGLRCRTGPSTGADVITTMLDGTYLTVRGLPVAGWVPVVCSGVDGWASGDFLSVVYATPTPGPSPTVEATETPTETPATETPATETPSATETPDSATEVPATSTPVDTTGSAVVTGTGGLGLRCRTGPSTGATQIGNLPEGSTVTLLGAATAGWYPVRCGGQDAWASSSYLQVVQEPAPPTQTPTPTSAPTETPTTTPTAAPPTPTPTTVPPTIAPDPSGSAMVTGTGGLGLRCRTGPSTGATQIGNLPEGSTVTLLGAPTAGWYPVRCGNQDGWASASYLQVLQAPGSPTPSPTATVIPSPTTTATMTATSTVIPPTTTPEEAGSARVVGTGGVGLRCRTAPSTAGAQIGSLAEGSIVPLLGPATGGWHPVRCNGQDGWASASYLEVIGSAGTATPTATTTPQFQTGTIANSGGANVRCRTQPSLSGGIIASYPEGTVLDVRGPIQGEWHPVRCAGTEGFVHGDYLLVNGTMAAGMVDNGGAAITSLGMDDESSPEPEAIDVTTPSTVEPEATEDIAPPVMEPTATLEEPTPLPTSIPVTGSGYVISDDGGAINCRTLPSTNAPIASAVAHGTWIELRGDPVNGWQGVRCDGVDGFMAAQFIGNAPPAPVVATEVPTEPLVEDQGSLTGPVAPQGSNPQFGGAQLPITNILDNGDGAPWNAIDGSTDTAWSGHQLTIDLGQDQLLTGVRWMYGPTGGPEHLRVELSVDAASWWTVDVWSDRQPYTWEGAWLGGSARYVRLTATSPATGDPGSIVEVQVWGTPIAAVDGFTAALVPVFTVKSLVRYARRTSSGSRIASRNVRQRQGRCPWQGGRLGMRQRTAPLRSNAPPRRET